MSPGFSRDSEMEVMTPKGAFPRFPIPGSAVNSGLTSLQSSPRLADFNSLLPLAGVAVLPTDDSSPSPPLMRSVEHQTHERKSKPITRQPIFSPHRVLVTVPSIDPLCN